MRRLSAIIIGIIVLIALGLVLAWRTPLFSALSPANEAKSIKTPDYESEENLTELWINTVMGAQGHTFGFKGDETIWGGWFYDTIPVGDDIMLKYDSIGPSTMKFTLVARTLTVDIGDPESADKIRSFMNPISGFKRCQNRYEEMIDSVREDEYSIDIFGYFSSCIDYADSSLKDSRKINRFICEITGASKSESLKVTPLIRFYAGFTTSKPYRPKYTGDVNDIVSLQDFLAERTFENWKREGKDDSFSNRSRLNIRAQIANSKFFTVSVYEYERIGLSHGCYTEGFLTMEMESGRLLYNNDIFKSGKMEKVKTLLFETMAKDSHFRAWHPGAETAEDVVIWIESWQTRDEPLDEDESEKPDSKFEFELPQAALTNEGVVFSFQPYEIDCYAAGTFHFVVPYKKVMPYLTPKVKRLIAGGADPDVKI